MRCACFGGGINAGFGAQAADFYLCVHIGPNSRHLRSRHAELVLALPAFGSSMTNCRCSVLSRNKFGMTISGVVHAAPIVMLNLFQYNELPLPHLILEKVQHDGFSVRL
jgi:hypothetical protein